MSEIQTAIMQLTGLHKADQVSTIACTVQSVSIPERNCICTSISNGAEIEIPGVLLMSEVSDGILIIPSIGSTVFVTYSRYCPPYISLFSDVDSISFLGGDKGGLVMVVELVNRLNAIENKLNSLVTNFNSHTHILTTGTASPTATQETGTLILTKRVDIENTKITHGN